MAKDNLKEAIREYLSELRRQFATGMAREHTYRPALQRLMGTLLPDLTVSNEPARQVCGAPDYILTRKGDGVPVAFIEAKDIGDPDLAGQNRHKQQFERYRAALDNILFTDYLDFRFYAKGALVGSVRLGEVKGNEIVGLRENFGNFRLHVNRFGNAMPQAITSPAQLAGIMADKARLLADVIERAFDGESDSDLTRQFHAFREVLIHDLTPKAFADVYAQTIAYGLFAARMHDPTPETFSRMEAATLIPMTNPFLRKFFQNVAGFDLDERISWIVDDLSETFRATDMGKVMEGFGERKDDPVVHFYEDFLARYNPQVRRSRGVWYTPGEVVRFIVRAVDDLLKDDFGLRMGLADTAKVPVERNVEQSHDKRYPDGMKKRREELHRVQILDPATGTGTFLAEAVSLIHGKLSGQEGMWQGYVEEHLLPRLYGFELLMTSYVMAHLKLDRMLSETGYKPLRDKRLQIYLTNSLENHHPDTGNLFSQFLAREANGANMIKRDTPVMVVLGNPPYSGESANKGDWIMRLMTDYKKEPGGREPLRERNPKWINDDYCKFIRLGQYYVDRRGEGILAYINNHGFLDNPTFRGMRWSLLRSFDKILVIDLHGNSKKREVCPDGSKDENVFDIRQGLSINIFVKTGRKPQKELAEVWHSDLWGRRADKFRFLSESRLSSVPFQRVNPVAPNYFFVPKNEAGREEYERGFAVNELMPENSVGIVTTRDALLMKDTPEEVESLVRDFIGLGEAELRTKYRIGKDSRDWSVARAKEDIGKTFAPDKVVTVDYRPFDRKRLYYTGKTNGLVAWPRGRVMRHFLAGENVGLLVCRQSAVQSWGHIGITENIVDDCRVSNRTKERGYVFPLYLYPEGESLSVSERVPNLNPEIVKRIAEGIGLAFEPEKSDDEGRFAPIDVFDYVYGVLHCPAYRERYKEFLKTGFPRIPCPLSAGEFRRRAETGGELRRIHLLEHPSVDEFVTRYPVPGNNMVGSVRWEPASESAGRVWINDTQHFDGVPLAAWELFIGGYQPAQKWLKDRTGKCLSCEDILHWQRIVKALTMTDEIMKACDADMGC